MIHKYGAFTRSAASQIAGLRTRHSKPLLLDGISGCARGGRALAPDAYRRVFIDHDVALTAKDPSHETGRR